MGKRYLALTTRLLTLKQPINTIFRIGNSYQAPFGIGTHYTPLLGILEVPGPGGQTFTKAEDGEEFGATLKDFMSLNISCNYMNDLQWTNLVFGLSINNILNRKNVKSRNYIPIFEERGELVDVEVKDIKLLGITPSLHVKLTF